MALHLHLLHIYLWNMYPLLVLFLLSPALLFSQDCHPLASTEILIPDSNKVVILGIGKNDLHFSNKQEYIGDTLLVKDGLVLNKDQKCEYSGTLRGERNKLLYFSHLQVKLLNSKTKILASDCRNDAMNGVNLEEGTEVTVLAISSSDIYSLIDPGLVGQKLKVKTQLTNFNDCWYSGTLEDEQKNVYVFTKIQVSSEGITPKGPFPLKNENIKLHSVNVHFCKDNIPKGFPVKILEIAPSDIMYEKKELLLNKTALATEELKETGDGWYMGSVRTKDGGNYYFFKVRLGEVD